MGKTMASGSTQDKGHSFSQYGLTFYFFLKPNKWLQKEPPTVSGLDGENTSHSQNQSDCRIC